MDGGRVGETCRLRSPRGPAAPVPPVPPPPVKDVVLFVLLVVVVVLSLPSSHPDDAAATSKVPIVSAAAGPARCQSLCLAFAMLPPESEVK